MRQHPNIRRAWCLFGRQVPTTKRLVGYFVARNNPEPQALELRRFVKSKLPDYMVPSFWVSWKALPLTPSGKLDRKSLPVPEAACHGSESPWTPVQNPLEKTIAAVWQELLHVEQIGAQDGFL